MSTTLRLTAALAILVAGAVHLDLWAAGGYRAIHVIGPLFLVNVVSAAVIAALLLAWGGVLVELAGVAYAVGTLLAFFASVYSGLFGFVESLDGTPQVIAALAEASAAMLLLLCVGEHATGRALARQRHVLRDEPYNS